MTPSFCWVFLLAFLVGRTMSIPQAIVVDACALLCNPGAETESDRARDRNLYPRVAKANCKPQSLPNEEQARVIARHCLQLCGSDLTISSEVNCFTLRSSLGAGAGCYCEALKPLSPNTIRLSESWRLKFMVDEIAKDIITLIAESPLDELIICEIYRELFDTNKNVEQQDLYKRCHAENATLSLYTEKGDIDLDTTTTMDDEPSNIHHPEDEKKGDTGEFLNNESTEQPKEQNSENVTPESRSGRHKRVVEDDEDEVPEWPMDWEYKQIKSKPQKLCPC